MSKVSISLVVSSPGHSAVDFYLDEEVSSVLHSVLKPFLLRRLKSEVSSPP